MKKIVNMDIAVNGAFITRRWENPENFIRLTKDCGYDYHSFCADVLDPFFSGNKKYQIATAKEIKKFAAKYNVGIVDYYTGVATHRFHGLSHCNPVVRKRMRQWIIEAMDIVKAMGCTRLGGHMDAFSVEILSKPKLKKAAYENIYRQFRDLSLIAKAKGLSAIYGEQMYIPSEIPWTLKETQDFLINTNKNNNGVPLRITIDVGHQAGVHYGLKGKDLDYEEWLRRFAAFTEIIHIQQTTRDASHHWPFIDKYNKKGIVRIEKVINAIKYSFEHCKESPVVKYLKPVDTVYLVAEIIPGSTKTEKVILSELKESAKYLRKFVPKNGLRIEYNS